MYTFKKLRKGSDHYYKSGLFWAFILLVLTSCAGLKEEKPEPAASASSIELVWPHSPAQPRITFFREILFPRDFRKETGLWERFKSLIIGEERASQIVRPYGLALDGQENLYIADTGAQKVHIYNLADGSYRQLPSKNDVLGLLSPIDVAVGAEGRIFVSDSAAGKVYIFSKNREKLKELIGLKRPAGLAIDQARDRLYVVETAAHRLKVFTLDGISIKDIGSRGDGPGKFNYPTNVCIDGKGNVLVTDSMNFRVQIFSASGKLLDSFGQAGINPGTFSKPRGIAVDSEGHIYVADAAFDNIQIFDRSGQLLLHFGRSGPALGEFALPAGLVMDDNDRIFVADSFNGRVQVFQYLKDNTPL